MKQEARKSILEFFSLSPLLKRLFISSLTVNTFFELAKIIPPFIFMKILDSILIFDPKIGISLPQISWLVGFYFLSLGSLTACEIAYRHFVASMISKTEADVLTRIVRQLLSLDTSFHERFNTGANMNKIIKGSDRLVEFLYRMFDNVTPIALQSIMTLIILAVIRWEVAITYILFASVYVSLMMYDAFLTQKIREKVLYYHGLFTGDVTQSIINIRTVKDFHAEDTELNKAQRFLDKFVEFCQVRHRLSKKAHVFEGLVLNFARVVTLSLGVYLLLNQKITPGLLVFIMTITEKAYINLGNLSVSYFRLQDATPSIKAFVNLMRQKSLIVDKTSSLIQPKGGGVEFYNVFFKYDPEIKTTAVENVSFEVKDRSIAALVGRSGAGKSTVVKLLFRHFDPTRGGIKINGQDIREYSLKNLRQCLALVSQDVELFNESVLDNILYGSTNVSKQDAIAAAKLSFAHDFIMNLPKGYDTKIGERGVRLSGGQKQRLAIARALVRKPKILVFDEATSSLDAESERFIHRAILNLKGKITLIIIAHRFSTIQYADRIILLDDGRVKEVGTHQELLKKKGIFAKLRQLQELGEVR